MPVVVALVDLYLDAVMDRVALVGRCGGDADKDARVATVVGHFVNHSQGSVRDFLARVPEHAGPWPGANGAVFHREAGPALRAGDSPSVQIFAVEQGPPVGRGGTECEKQK